MIVTKERTQSLSRLRGFRGGIFLAILAAGAMCTGCLGEDDDQSYRVVRKASKKRQAQAKAQQAAAGDEYRMPYFLTPPSVNAIPLNRTSAFW